MENKELYELVIEEATNLKKFATKEELNKLDFNTLAPSSINKCIYGQMFDGCNSLRAIELIKKCCNKVYNSNDELIKPKDIYRAPFKFNCWSPIEKFLYYKENWNYNVSNLVQFLKSETETLKLN